MEIVNEEQIKGTLKEPPVVTISYDQKPGIQALATTTPDLRRSRASSGALFGTTGTNVWERCCCWLALISTPAASLRSSATTTRRTFQKRRKDGSVLIRVRLHAQARSWLNIVETMCSKMARSMPPGIRVASRQELIDRIHLYFQHINADPVIFRWNYKWTRGSLANYQQNDDLGSRIDASRQLTPVSASNVARGGGA